MKVSKVVSDEEVTSLRYFIDEFLRFIVINAQTATSSFRRHSDAFENGGERTYYGVWLQRHRLFSTLL